MAIINNPGGGSLSGVVISGAGASGKVPVASSASAGTWAFPPGYEFGYDQITASVTVTATSQANGTTIIGGSAHTFDGAAVIAEFFSPEVVSDVTAAGDILLISLFEAATQIGVICQVKTVVTANAVQVPVTGKIRFTPSAASHTYSITASSTANNGATIVAGAGGTAAYVPAYLRFTKV